jgi:hypothetical protein
MDVICILGGKGRKSGWNGVYSKSFILVSAFMAGVEKGDAWAGVSWFEGIVNWSCGKVYIFMTEVLHFYTHCKFEAA